MEWSREAAAYRWNMRSIQKIIREKPEEIHWPTPDEPQSSWPGEFNVVVKERRRNFVVAPAE